DEPKQRTHLNQYQTSSIQSYGKRSHNFFRTANVLNWGRKLGRSSTIKIIYSLSSNNHTRERMLEEFWQILSRLKARAKMHVYFLAVRTNPAASELTDDWISDDIFDSFACYYLVNALCSRGYAVLDQIDAKFVTVVADASKINAKATEKALE
uniref:Uncharacterized protein n=1 Tax=Romanomermis culicivorax TaxID=13658 RepID=A0A915JU70_ROMCU